MPLTPKQEYAARWLDRAGEISLRQATQREGIERPTLDALVRAGRAERIDGPDPVYRSTSTDHMRHAAGQMRDPRSTRLERPPDEKIIVLTSREEYVARWLDRTGYCSLRQARQQGVDPTVLDVLVTYGRAARVDGPEPGYRTTAVAPPDPSLAVAAEELREVVILPVPEPGVVLTRQEERVARWLRRAGRCSLRQAQEHGIDQVVLDVVVRAGRARRLEGDDPIYEAVIDGVVWRPAQALPGPPREPVVPQQLPVIQRAIDLLKDGVPRTPAEVAGALTQNSSNFVESRETYRKVQDALPVLASRGLLHRLMFGIPVVAGRPGQYRYDEKYVDAASVVPVCQICFRQHWGAEAIPPQSSGHPIELCSVCGKRTNDPSFVSKTETEEKRDAGP